LFYLDSIKMALEAFLQRIELQGNVDQFRPAAIIPVLRKIRGRCRKQSRGEGAVA
jgi:hypothetical protein